ncbi:cupin domain-containing protein [Geobacter benzoatilyticus]|uniref:Cupin domain-containing protein n=1 Tax=Geobacter benzoatilyticus TaxID=2815309 RepID=A0ABX7Q8B0_9BACT|nr:cupin domain-containing protein [Geobacter benzoatilyticus]QSV47275.1 cupin domain-containing protein [Geobacter benzoatilyticus]
MKSQVLDVQTLKKFSDEKRHQETIWSDDHARVSLICMKPGQEIVTHTHHGSHIWTVMEGTGEFLSGGKTQSITTGQIVVVPAFEDHGIRNASQENLVIASITGQGD